MGVKKKINYKDIRQTMIKEKKLYVETRKCINKHLPKALKVHNNFPLLKHSLT